MRRLLSSFFLAWRGATKFYSFPQSLTSFKSNFLQTWRQLRIERVLLGDEGDFFRQNSDGSTKFRPNVELTSGKNGLGSGQTFCSKSDVKSQVKNVN